MRIGFRAAMRAVARDGRRQHHDHAHTCGPSPCARRRFDGTEKLSLFSSPPGISQQRRGSALRRQRDKLGPRNIFLNTRALHLLGRTGNPPLAFFLFTIYFTVCLCSQHPDKAGAGGVCTKEKQAKLFLKKKKKGFSYISSGNRPHTPLVCFSFLKVSRVYVVLWYRLVAVCPWGIETFSSELLFWGETSNASGYLYT